MLTINQLSNSKGKQGSTSSSLTINQLANKSGLKVNLSTIPVPKFTPPTQPVNPATSPWSADKLKTDTSYQFLDQMAKIQPLAQKFLSGDYPGAKAVGEMVMTGGVSGGPMLAQDAAEMVTLVKSAPQLIKAIPQIIKSSGKTAEEIFQTITKTTPKLQPLAEEARGIGLKVDTAITKTMQGFEDTKGLTQYQITKDGKVIGEILATKGKDPDMLFVKRITIDEPYQRQGIGTQVLNDLQNKLGTKYVRTDNNFTAEGKEFFTKYNSNLTSPLEGGVKGVEKLGKARVNPAMFDTPEVLKAREQAKSIPSTHNINTPERLAMREKIVNDVYGTGAKNKNRRADLVIGSPASGKSSRLVDPLVKKHGAFSIDADDIKKLLPEYNNGIGAAATHRESALMADLDLVSRAVENGDNIVLSRLGKNTQIMEELVDLLKQSGYEVHLHFMDLPSEEAAKRVVTRFQETGRFIDPQYILSEVDNKPEITYNILKKNPNISSYERYSNDVPRGTEPKLIEHSDNALSSSERRVVNESNNPSIEKTPSQQKGSSQKVASETLISNIKAAIGDTADPAVYVNKLNQAIKDNIGQANVQELKAIRAFLNKERFNLAGADSGFYKTDYAYLQNAKKDPLVGPMIDAIEQNIASLDQKIKAALEPVKPVLNGPVGQGEQAVSKLGLRVEQTAIEKKLTEEFSDLPQYQQMDMKEQAKLAAQLLIKDPEKALRVALGQEVPPQGLLAESVFKAMENSVTTSEIAQKLATSPLVSEATALGQRIKALGVDTSDSPVEAIRQVMNARAEAIKARTGKAVDEAVKKNMQDIKSKVKLPDKYDWGAFLDSVKC